METLTVTILEPKARKLFDDLASLNLIKVEVKIDKEPKRKPRKFGSMKDLVVHIADDFDAPSKEFSEFV